MAENNLGNTQYFRIKTGSGDSGKRDSGCWCTMQWKKRDIIR